MRLLNEVEINLNVARAVGVMGCFSLNSSPSLDSKRCFSLNS